MNTANAARCKHGTLVVFCVFCSPPPETPNDRRPAERKDVTIFGVAALDGKKLERAGYVVVHPMKGKGNNSFNDLNVDTRFVHIDGMPFLWAITLILEMAPNVKTIQVTPLMKRKLHPRSHLRLCEERGVEVATGYHKPEGSGARRKPLSPFYERQRKFFRTLEGEQKALFDELLAMNFDAAIMTARYFCLNDEEYVAQRTLAEEYCFEKSDERQVSMRTNAIIYYLDPSFDAGERSQQFANMLKRRVENLRPFLRSAELRQRLCEQLGLTRLPDQLPIWRIQVFRGLLQARKDGRLQRLMAEHNRPYRAITLRFGIEEEEPTQYRRLEQIGKVLDLTRERVRQLEAAALEALGIEDET